MHVEALQWPNSSFPRRLRANCHQLYELGNANYIYIYIRICVYTYTHTHISVYIYIYIYVTTTKAGSFPATCVACEESDNCLVVWDNVYFKHKQTLVMQT